MVLKEITLHPGRLGGANRKLVARIGVSIQWEMAINELNVFRESI